MNSLLTLLKEAKPSRSVDAGQHAGPHALSRAANLTQRSRASAEWAKESRPDLRVLADKQLNCGSWLLLEDAAGLTRLPRILAGNWCNLPHTCFGCAQARALRRIRDVMPNVIDLVTSDPRPMAYFVTATVRSGKELPETYSRLDLGLKQLTQARSKGRSALGNVLGGLTIIETKRSQQNQDHWHPHAHSIWFSSGVLDFQRVSEYWSKIQDEPSRVWFDKLPEGEDPIAAIHRCIMYSCKLSDNPADNWDAASVYRSLHARLFRRFGSLRASKSECETDEQTISRRSSPSYSIPFVRYSFSEGRYVVAS